MPSRFYEQEVQARLTNRRRLSAFLDDLVSLNLRTVKKVQLTYIFCNDDYLQTLNREFLNHDTLTDIITFDLSENKSELKAEIYISTERVEENAAIYKSGYNQELHRVIFHGALHLCGFGDKSTEEKQAMRREEDLCLRAYFAEQKA